MPTARFFIQDALELLRVFAPGEDATGPDMARGLSVLNAMLDSWSNESLTCFAWQTIGFPLVPGKSTYTIGPNGAINQPRPLRLSDDVGAAYLLDENANKYSIEVVDQMTFNLRTSAAVNANLPDTVMYDPQYPLGIINIWPTPSQAYTCYVSAFLPLTEFATLDTAVNFPPGYNRAISTNLAISLHPYFKDGPLNPLLMKEASDTKGAVKRTNMRSQRAVFDPELTARGNASYNIYSDRMGR